MLQHWLFLWLEALSEQPPQLYHQWVHHYCASSQICPEDMNYGEMDTCSICCVVAAIKSNKTMASWFGKDPMLNKCHTLKCNIVEHQWVDFPLKRSLSWVTWKLCAPDMTALSMWCSVNEVPARHRMSPFYTTEYHNMWLYSVEPYRVSYLQGTQFKELKGWINTNENKADCVGVVGKQVNLNILFWPSICTHTSIWLCFLHCCPVLTQE